MQVKGVKLVLNAHRVAGEKMSDCKVVRIIMTMCNKNEGVMPGKMFNFELREDTLMSQQYVNGIERK